MIKFYRTDHKVLSEITEYEDNMWVCMTKPTVDETKLIAEDFEIDLADVRAAWMMRRALVWRSKMVYTDPCRYSVDRDEK